MTTSVTISLGRTVITANCLREIGDAIGRKRQEAMPAGFETARESLDLLASLAISGALARHRSGDWGDIDPNDQGLNEQALEDGSRLLSVYYIHGVKVWVITDGETNVCPACWAGIGLCDPEQGSYEGGMHFRDDRPAQRLSTTVLLPEDY